MRHSDKEITDPAVIAAILAEASVCRLAMSRDNLPYIVPLNFAYHDNCLFMHAANEGLKLDILRVNPNVCFEVEARVAVVPTEGSCSWTCNYFSVIGFGRIAFIEAAADKHRALEVFMERYSDRGNWQFPDDLLGKVTLLRLNISQMTGKRSGYESWSETAPQNQSQGNA